jgi:hypothetical protein
MVLLPTPGNDENVISCDINGRYVFQNRRYKKKRDPFCNSSYY